MRTLPLLLVTALALAACSSQRTAEPGSGSAVQTGNLAGGELYASITRAGAPFYQYGPAQPSGPDFHLDRGDLVKLVRKESGFSQVQLEGGQNGYIANSYLAAADAPSPPPAPAVEMAETVALPSEPSRSPQPPSPTPVFRLGTSQEVEPIRFR